MPSWLLVRATALALASCPHRSGGCGLRDVASQARGVERLLPKMGLSISPDGHLGLERLEQAATSSFGLCSGVPGSTRRWMVARQLPPTMSRTVCHQGAPHLPERQAVPLASVSVSLVWLT